MPTALPNQSKMGCRLLIALPSEAVTFSLSLSRSRSFTRMETSSVTTVIHGLADKPFMMRSRPCEDKPAASVASFMPLSAER